MREMKDSGIEWIGEIPLDWQAIKLKFVMDNFDYERIPVDSTKRSQDGEQLYDYYGASGVIDQIDGYTSEGERILIGEDGANLLLRNLPVIYIANGKYWVNNHAHILKPKGNGNLHFFANQMECIDYTEYITGSAQPKLSQSNLGQVWLVVPPVEEQNLISAYLDSKCAEIDALTADIQTQIDTLEQYKRSVITEAVTRGLDKNVEMKDSGIEWAEQIPAHWRTMHNKYLMHKVKEICPVYNGEDILSLTMQGVIVRDFELGGKMPASFDGYQIIHPGNLLMCLFDYDVTPRCIGYINNEGLTSPAYSQFVMEPIADAHYYYYYYLMLDFTKELLHLAKNLRHSFTEEQLGEINTVVPPVNEQREIAGYLDNKVAIIDEAISLKNDQLSTLDAYKKSIIYEYVTGKKEVPSV
jgi:type I restriction enzyme S subunit